MSPDAAGARSSVLQAPPPAGGKIGTDLLVSCYFLQFLLIAEAL